MITLIYLSSWPIGGSTSFTVHLYCALKLAGAEVQIVKLGSRTEKNERPLGKYGVTYRRMSYHDLIAQKTTMLITAGLSKNKEIDYGAINGLLKEGARSVIHDANELKIYNNPELLVRPIVIRKTNLHFGKDAVFIPHPYVRRRFDDKHFDIGTRKNAVSIARTSFTKNSHVILEANRKVPPELAVHLKGELHRSFMFRFKKDYPELMSHTMGFAKTWDAPVDICSQYLAMVDLTLFDKDGGGSQYSFMEAMDAGTLCIVNRGWLDVAAGESELQHGINCLAVSNADELAQVLKDIQGPTYPVTDMIRNGYAFLAQHDAKRIGERYRQELGA